MYGLFISSKSRICLSYTQCEVCVCVRAQFISVDEMEGGKIENYYQLRKC